MASDCNVSSWIKQFSTSEWNSSSYCGSYWSAFWKLWAHIPEERKLRTEKQRSRSLSSLGLCKAYSIRFQRVDLHPLLLKHFVVKGGNKEQKLFTNNIIKRNPVRCTPELKAKSTRRTMYDYQDLKVDIICCTHHPSFLETKDFCSGRKTVIWACKYGLFSTQNKRTP